MISYTWLCRVVLLLASMGLAACGSIEKNHRSAMRDGSGGFDLPGQQIVKTFTRSTVGATLKAPLSSTRTGVIMLTDRTYTLVRGSLPEVRLRDGASMHLPTHAGGAQFESYLDQQGFAPRTTGQVTYLVEGSKFFPELRERIQQAEHSVDIQTYIFDNDQFALGIANELKTKSRDVPVRVYFDALGSEVSSAKPPESEGDDGQRGPAMHRYLEQDSRVQVRRFYNPWLVADHTKLHIIDGRVAYVGGINIGREYLDHWHDLMARIEGPVVADLSRVFESRWRRESPLRNYGLGWLVRHGRTQPRVNDRDASRDVPLRLLITDTSIGKREILKATLIAIRSADRRVWIETPYFSSDEITAELVAAVHRGVDVRVVIPGKNDTEIMQAVNYASLERVVKAGGSVYQYPGMTHLKALVCDDWATFGSSNYDTLSLRINRELNLASSHPDVVEGLVRKVFLPDFKKSRRLSVAAIEKQSSGALVEFAGDQL